MSNIEKGDGFQIAFVPSLFRVYLGVGFRFRFQPVSFQIKGRTEKGWERGHWKQSNTGCLVNKFAKLIFGSIFSGTLNIFIFVIIHSSFDIGKITRGMAKMG